MTAALEQYSEGDAVRVVVLRDRDDDGKWNADKFGLGSTLVPEQYDYIALTYTGANLTSVVYKTGGAAGTTVATLTLAYTGAVLDSVART